MRRRITVLKASIAREMRGKRGFFKGPAPRDARCNGLDREGKINLTLLVHFRLMAIHHLRGLEPRYLEMKNEALIRLQ
jgi:hypothetical protein